jgi:PQQ system protein
MNTRTWLLPVAVFATIGLSAMSSAQTAVGELLRLLRPEVLRQLNNDVLRLVNFLPEVDGPNKAIIARLFAHGGLGHAKIQKDGSHRFSLRVPNGQFIFRPAIIVMGKAGKLDIDVKNEDEFSHHQILLPNNGGRMFMQFAPGETKKTTIELDGPGLYWFGCPVGNHAGRGMLGLILVLGETPDEAKLDRPRQKR